MKKTFDLIVIGTGSAAVGVASRCRSAGWSVSIIDSLPYGGTCALRGCDPKKVLVGVSEALDWVRRLKDKLEDILMVNTILIGRISPGIDLSRYGQQRLLPRRKLQTDLLGNRPRDVGMQGQYAR